MKHRIYGGLLVALVLAGCGGGDGKSANQDRKQDNNQAKKTSQVMARVGGEEITALQVNQELQRNGVSAGQDPQLAKQVLDALIDRQLLVNEAVQGKLDRDPDVLLAIEAARAQILLQAYMQRKLANIAKPGDAEIADYYKQHPEFFSQRKLFQLSQVVFLTSDYSPTLQAAIESAKRIAEVTTWLTAHQIKFKQGNGIRSSTELPPEMSKQMLAHWKDELFVVKGSQEVVVFAVTAVKDQPVDEAAAKQTIEQGLWKQKRDQATADDIKRLRAATKIEYVGDALSGASAPQGGGNAAAQAPGQAAAGLK